MTLPSIQPDSVCVEEEDRWPLPSETPTQGTVDWSSVTIIHTFLFLYHLDTLKNLLMIVETLAFKNCIDISASPEIFRVVWLIKFLSSNSVSAFVFFASEES